MSTYVCRCGETFDSNDPHALACKVVEVDVCAVDIDEVRVQKSGSDESAERVAEMGSLVAHIRERELKLVTALREIENAERHAHKSFDGWPDLAMRRCNIATKALNTWSAS